MSLIFKNIDVRFIEYMPFEGNKWSTRKLVSFKEMMKLIAQNYSIESIQRLEDQQNDTSKVKEVFFEDANPNLQFHLKTIFHLGPHLKNLF